MRLVTLATVAVLSTATACSSDQGSATIATPPVASAGTTAPAGTATTPAPANSNANIPGFSGPAKPATDTQPGHIFGDCLHSWFTSTSKALRVHVEYPGPADINVDVMMLDGFTPPAETHQFISIPLGQQGKDVTFPAIAHADYVQINVLANRGALTCDAPKH